MPVPPIHAVNESIFGSSYEEHVKKFWQTFLEIPLASNPLYVEDMCEGSQNSSEPVFYLPPNLGTTTTKNCRTSEGKSILIPVICVVVLPHEVDPQTLLRQRRVANTDEDSVTSMQLDISTSSSGITLNKPELLNFRIRTGTFTAQMPSGGLYDAPEGLTNCVADGYYVITRPILAGNYVFKFSGRLNCTGPDCVPGEKSFRTDNTVNLRVT
jgi:hypothetical protein